MQGLRFECQPGCTACCEQKGFVYLTDGDLVRVAEFLGMKPAAFERKYCYRTRHLLRLRIPKESNCHFLREGGCSIHPPSRRSAVRFPSGPNWWRVAANGRRRRTTAPAWERVL